MNNSFNNTNNLPQQHQHQNAQQQSAQSIGYLPAHAHIQQQNSHQHQQHDEHFTATGTYFDASALEKTYTNYAGAPGRYFTATTAGLPNMPTPHNTILITNNFTQQNMPSNAAVANATLNAAANNYNNTNNIRILSAAAANNNNNLFNLGKDATIDASTLHLPHAHFFQSHQHQQNTQFATHLPNLQQTNQYHPHFATLATQQQHLNHGTMHFGNIPVGGTAVAAAATTTPPSHYFPHGATEQLANIESNKLLPALVDINTSTGMPKSAATTTTTVTPNNNSTVVLDHINICINNHYNDPANTNNNLDVPLSCARITTADGDNITPQQPSPVIPAIQHKAAILPDNVVTLIKNGKIANLENNNSVTAVIHVIDEPDSTTTTAHTPPTTPNNVTTEQMLLLNSPLHQSPTTTTTTTAITMIASDEIALANIMEKQQTIDIVSKITNENAKEATPTTTIVIDCDENDDEENDEIAKDDEEEKELNEEEQSSNDTYEIEKLTPPSQAAAFKIGEDVLLKRQDNRFYLGTVIGSARQQYLVRFDDQSEQWCLADEMRKLGGGINENANKSDGSSAMVESSNLEIDTPMCVACKRRRTHDIVECCERCGRGYHRGCTSEMYPGSGVWLCKR